MSDSIAPNPVTKPCHRPRLSVRWMVSMLIGPMGKETNNPMIKPWAIVSSIIVIQGEDRRFFRHKDTCILKTDKMSFSRHGIVQKSSLTLHNNSNRRKPPGKLARYFLRYSSGSIKKRNVMISFFHTPYRSVIAVQSESTFPLKQSKS